MTNYVVNAESEMVYKVNGTGFIANLLRNVTSEIDEKNSRLVAGSNQKCDFPVRQLTLDQYVILARQLVLLICAILFELYVKRFNKVIYFIALSTINPVFHALSNCHVLRNFI